MLAGRGHKAGGGGLETEDQGQRGRTTQTLRRETGRVLLGSRKKYTCGLHPRFLAQGFQNPRNFLRGGVREASLLLITPLPTTQEFMLSDDQTVAVTQAAPS